MKKLFCLCIALILIFTLVSCKQETNDEPGGLGGSKLLSVRLKVSFDSNTVSEDEKFGAALLNMSQEEFEAIGFVLGDSLDISFQNGYAMEDVPYYNGYYVKNGNPVVVAYPGNPYVSITLNNVGIWEQANLSDGDSVLITRREQGKYLDIQESLGQIYSFIRNDYPSDESFSNFRAMTGGNLKENFLFRGASPVDNSRNRAPYADSLLEKNEVKYVIDLADSKEDMEGYISGEGFSSNYTKQLYNDGNVSLLDMGSSYSSKTYKEKVVKGLREAISKEGPIYIHCMEGKDRTGFVCMLLEALAGASYEEMLSDYMITYKNYYKVSKEETPEKYNAIAELYFVSFVEFLHGTEDREILLNADYSEDAANYLKDGGMTADEVNALLNFITK